MLWIVVPSGMLGERQGVPDPGLGLGAGDDDVADLQAVGQEHVALLAVTVVKEADPGRAVRVVLDRRELGRHAELVALEVDDAVVLLLAAAAVANGQAALVVAAGAALLRLEERLVGLLGGDLLERRAGHEPPAGRGGLVASQRHGYTPSKNSIFWPAASVTIALRQGVVQPRDPAALGAAALLLGLRREDVDRRDLDLEELLDGRLDLDLGRVVVDRERVLAVLRLVHRLLADDRPDDHLVGGERHAYTSSICARAGCSITIVSALSRSTTLSESASMTSTRAGSGPRGQALVRAGATIRTRPSTLRSSRTPTRSRGPDLLEPERVDDPDGVAAELGGQRAEEREALHLAGQALGVRARMGTEDHAAAGEVRRRAWSPGGPGRCPSGDTASCRRRRPRRASSCRGCRAGDRPAGRSRPGGGRRR